MIKVLGITATKIEKAIIDMAYSLIDQGYVMKTDDYKSK